MFPNLPTDNLYKFCFVGAIISAIVFYITLGNSVSSFESARKDILMQQLKIESEKNILTSEMTILNDLLKTVTDSVSAVLLSKKKEELKARYHDFKYSAEKHSIEVKDIERLESSLIGFKKATYCGITVSIVLAFIFGLIWYFKVQSVEDEIVLLKREKLKGELTSNTNKT